MKMTRTKSLIREPVLDVVEVARDASKEAEPIPVDPVLPAGGPGGFGAEDPTVAGRVRVERWVVPAEVGLRIAHEHVLKRNFQMNF